MIAIGSSSIEGCIVPDSVLKGLEPVAGLRPEFHQAVDRLLAACKKHGKAPGFLATSVPMAREWRAKGIRCLCYGTDIGVFQTALSGALGELKADRIG